MRLVNAWYFVVKDTTAYLKKNKKAILFALLFVLVGIILGIIVSLNVKESEYISYLNQIFQNTFNGFSVFFNFAGLTFVCLLIIFFSLFFKWTRWIPFVVLVYCGYMIGRAIILNIVFFNVVGVFSLLLFLLPAYFVMVGAIIIVVLHTKNIPLCGFMCMLKLKNYELLKYILKYYVLCVLFYFAIFVMLGGIMNIIFNIA